MAQADFHFISKENIILLFLYQSYKFCIIIKLRYIYHDQPKQELLILLSLHLLATVRSRTSHWAVDMLQPWWPGQWSVSRSPCTWQSAGCICAALAGLPPSCSIPALFGSPRAVSTWPAEPEPAADSQAWRRDEWGRAPQKKKKKSLLSASRSSSYSQRWETVIKDFFIYCTKTHKRCQWSLFTSTLSCFVLSLMIRVRLLIRGRKGREI